MTSLGVVFPRTRAYLLIRSHQKVGGYLWLSLAVASMAMPCLFIWF